MTNRQVNTTAPSEIGTAMKDDGESALEEGDQRFVDSTLQAVYRKGVVKENGVLDKVRVGVEKGTMVAKVARMEERSHGKKAAAKKAARNKKR